MPRIIKQTNTFERIFTKHKSLEKRAFKQMHLYKAILLELYLRQIPKKGINKQFIQVKIVIKLYIVDGKIIKTLVIKKSIKTTDVWTMNLV